MKFNDHPYHCPLNIRDKIIRFMKCTTLFLVILACYSFADSYAQKTKLDLEFKNATIIQIIESIENQSEFIFVYNDELLPTLKIQTSNVSLKRATIDKVLDRVLDKKGVLYIIEGRQIILKKGVLQSTNVLPVNLEQVDVQSEISGTVTDKSGVPLPGVNILVQGTISGTQTDFDGNFSIEANEGDVLIFSYLGMKTKQVTVGTSITINVILEEDAATLDEVVVTALGISREKKGLGYAVQELQGDDLNEARESNFVNSLSGKVAGVNITTSGAVGSSSRVVIRGESSLNFGGNEPLYIVDGIPVGNDGTNNATDVDYGNSAAEINPADVESLTVLKGPAAAALYGSRAANGAIVITTKSGKDGQGLGVTFTSGTTMETILRLPKFQNEFGGGRNGIFEGSNFGASSSIYPDGLEDGYDESWGPRLDVGTLERQFHSPTLGRMRGGDVANPNRGEVIPTPWISRPDNIKDFFNTGYSIFNNIALTGSNDRGNFRLSYTNLDQTGTIPNNDLERNTIAFKSSYRLSNKFSVNAAMSYINTKSSNRPETGYGRRSIMYFMNWSVRNMDIDALRDYWQEGFEGTRQFQYNYGENHNNPFFYQFENTRAQDKNRLFGNVSLTYDFSEHFSLIARGGTDLFNDFRPMRWAPSTVGREFGSYREVTRYFEENNFDFLLRYKNKIGDKFNYVISGGGNHLKRNQRYRSIEAPQLLIPGIYSIANSAADVLTESNDSEKVINSLYAFTNFDYDNTFFVDITARNDWSSTLPAKNNSYFYPSISFSTLVDQLLPMPEWVSLAKIRLGAAQVGSDTDPYSLNNTFGFAGTWGSNSSLSSGNSLLNNNLKPETVTTYEIGTDIRLFNNRLGLDVTYYDTRSKDQIIQVPLAASTSYSDRVINAGEIQNKGFEVMLNATPIEFENGFKWSTFINYSQNEGKVLELADGITAIIQQAPGEDGSIQARIGEEMGAIWGPGYQRVESGPMQGEIIIFDNGRPRATSEQIYLGNFNPDWQGSWGNTFSYKNISLSVLVDVRWGGEFISRFFNKGVGAGQLIETRVGRSAREIGREYDDPYYKVGAAQLPDGTYVPNSTSTDGTFSEGVYGTDARQFHKSIDHISEAQLFDATFAKLRELRFGYQFPNEWFKGLIRDVQFSIVGRNLFLWTPDSNQHFDPEVATATGGGGLIPGFENMSLPSTRSVGFNLNMKF
ncbi:SusC/RagA family TonB-linked outer membrane protein [Ulvibacterium marinum]|uniref:SusC/RagA family TonB-linked outer membrane protein n=2 Tax=Ulvibacterium marinum TaxID=2419782 RepID=A0A3B0C2F4_9FLAO|nr:SusC/RagA family TonB-linked outer membrane protein [Ulvibacterium marinum]